MRALVRAIALAAALACPGAAHALDFPVHHVSPQPPAWQSSDRCRGCHEDIHREWRASRHRMAGLAEGGAYAEVWKRFAAALERRHGAPLFFCAVCHTPSHPELAALAAGRAAPEPDSAQQQEGVGCHFCHSITGLRSGRQADTYALRVDGTMRGPLREAKPTSHGAAYSPLHRRGRVCAGCHGFLHLEGVQICSMDEEPEMELDCQHCHMPVTPGAPAAGSRRAAHAGHFMPGGHSPRLLARAATLGLSRRGEGFRVRVRNHSPHNLPSTQPLRLVVLRLEGRDASGKVVWRNFRDRPWEDPQAVFMKRFGTGDKVGVPTWQAERVAADSRLAGGASRELSYPLPAGAVELRARLLYFLAPPRLVAKLGISEADYQAQPFLLAEARLALEDGG
jgi:hypothetical protein